MRIWDLPPEILCDRHLLAEHAELHALWSILTKGKKGYANHPETRRWRGKLKALFRRHKKQISQLEKRGFKHQSPLDKKVATGEEVQNEFLVSPQRQIEILKAKSCKCPLRIKK